MDKFTSWTQLSEDLTALARMELAVFVTEWLRRIPNFQVEPGFVPEVIYRNVFTLASLPLQWGHELVEECDRVFSRLTVKRPGPCF